MQVIMAVTGVFRNGCIYQIECHFQKPSQHAVQKSHLLHSQIIFTILNFCHLLVYVGMVTDFPIHYMHAARLRVTRKLLYLWTMGTLRM